MKNKLLSALPQQREIWIQDGNADHAVGTDEHFQQSDSLQTPSWQQSATILVYHYVLAASALVCDSHSCGTADMNVQKSVYFKLYTEIYKMQHSTHSNFKLCLYNYPTHFSFHQNPKSRDKTG